MSATIPNVVLLNSLYRLADALWIAQIPDRVLQQALQENPWSSPYYISRSLEGIRSWLKPEVLDSFLDNYPDRPAVPLRIGIITAGNLPLVGFHDLLIGLLSGHQVILRPSHQDRTLMTWVVTCWQSLWPQLHQQLLLVEKLPEVDFLLATGSNNTARYLRSQYKNVPQLIRQNRFSVAVLNEAISEENLQLLTQDVLLYNGLGCRNVSTLIVQTNFSKDRWLRTLHQYPKHYLHPYYLERVLHEKHKMKMLGASFIDGEIILMQTVKTLKYASMGVLNLLWVDDESAVEPILKNQQDRLQCIVGITTPYGQTQMPAIDDFADGVDTMALLTCL